MAKKTTPGRGQKQCPNCDAIVAARSNVCPNCEHKFRKKRKKRSAKSKPSGAQAKSSTVSDELIATVLSAQVLIQRCGGTKAAINLIKSVGDV